MFALIPASHASHRVMTRPPLRSLDFFVSTQLQITPFSGFQQNEALYFTMSLLMNKGIYIVAAKRTPFGAFGGTLKNVTATQLGVTAAKACGIEDPSTMIDQCYFGNVVAAGNDAAYIARHVALQTGCAIDTPSLTLNRLCGSGFETILQACKAILLDEAQVVLAGGTEQMSQAPMTVRGDKIRWGSGPLGSNVTLEDSLWAGLTDAYAGTPMGITAEKLGAKYDITREECDAYALQSQQRHAAAVKAGRMQAEMAPVTVSTRKGDVVFDHDEHARPDSTMESMTKLKPVFQKDGLVTAASASGICDGAGALVVASEEAVKLHGFQPLCRIVSASVTGVPPEIMGIGPVSAIRNALAIADVDLAEVDVVEINEAFAAQVLSCQKELELDDVNPDGGAIALGHPLGASGSRIAAHLAHGGHKKSIGAACIGGGQGIAVLLEGC